MERNNGYFWKGTEMTNTANFESFDSPVAPAEEGDAYCDDCGHDPCTCCEPPDPYDVAIDREAERREVSEIAHEMSDLGRFLCDTFRAINRAYYEDMKAGVL